MPGSIACLGDQTSHGGVVVAASGTISVNGRMNARVGDAVVCPAHPYIVANKIVAPGGALMDNGVPVATAGCSTTCGSVLIAASPLLVAS